MLRRGLALAALLAAPAAAQVDCSDAASAVTAPQADVLFAAPPQAASVRLLNEGALTPPPCAAGTAGALFYDVDVMQLKVCNSIEYVTVVSSVCGNGVVEAWSGEECDDGNTTDLDGCSATCKVDAGTNCIALRDAGAPSGVYALLDASGGQAYCDMETEGGGWMAIATLSSGGLLCQDLTTSSACGAYDPTTPSVAATVANAAARIVAASEMIVTWRDDADAIDGSIASYEDGIKFSYATASVAAQGGAEAAARDCTNAAAFAETDVACVDAPGFLCDFIIDGRQFYHGADGFRTVYGTSYGIVGAVPGQSSCDWGLDDAVDLQTLAFRFDDGFTQPVGIRQRGPAAPTAMTLWVR